MIDQNEHTEPNLAEGAVESNEYEAPKTLNQLKRFVSDFLDISRDNAELVKRDRDYYDGYQISETQSQELRKRGQPLIYTNKIRTAVNGLLGIIDTQETVPEAMPRNYDGQNAADMVTKVLRYLAEKGNLKKIKKQCSENFFIDGCCAAALDFTDQHITISRIRWDEFIHDPLSREHDFTDSSYFGCGKLMDRDDVRALFGDGVCVPQTEKLDFGFFNDEKAKGTYWQPTDRHLVRVVDMYYRVGADWHRMIFTANEILFSGLSEFKDEDGASLCPIIAHSFEVNRGGDRYGVARDMIPLQDSVNARGSRLLHLINHRQVRQTALNAPTANRSIAKVEAAKADGVIPYGYEPVPTQDLAQGQMIIYQQNMAELERMAPAPSVLGRAGGANESAEPDRFCRTLE